MTNETWKPTDLTLWQWLQPPHHFPSFFPPSYFSFSFFHLNNISFLSLSCPPTHPALLSAPFISSTCVNRPTVPPRASLGFPIVDLKSTAIRSFFIWQTIGSPLYEPMAFRRFLSSNSSISPKTESPTSRRRPSAVFKTSTFSTCPSITWPRFPRKPFPTFGY